MLQGIYRSYAFVPDLYWHAWSKLRGEAFVQEMRKNGFPVETYRLRSRELDLSRLSEWLKRLPKPVGIFVAFDNRAIQVLEACRRLLVTTNGTLSNIADSCAFRKLDRLNAAFKRRYGMSMSEYRANRK